MERDTAGYRVRCLLLVLLMLLPLSLQAASLQSWLQRTQPDQAPALIDAYLSVWRAGQLLALSDANSRSYAQIERQLNLRLQAGIGDAETVLDVRNRRLRAQRLLQLDQQVRERALDAFRALTGEAPGALTQPSPPDFSALPDTIEALLDDPRLQRADAARRERIRQLWRQRQEARQGLAVAARQRQQLSQKLHQVTQQFIDGAQPFTALVEAETDLYSANRAHVKAHTELLLREYLLWQATGFRLRQEPLHPFDV